MYDDTPNKEEIDRIAERIRSLYNYERLKECDIDFLHNLEFAVENRMMIFETIFPPSDSSMQGPMRAFINSSW